MDLILKAFDLFNHTAKQLAGHFPQSGSDLMDLFKKAGLLLKEVNPWINKNIGVDLQAILLALGKIIISSVHYLLDIVKSIVAKLN